MFFFYSWIENLVEHLQDAIKDIEELIEGKKVCVGNKEYSFKVVLTCDMKALAPFLGMNNTFHPKSIFKCMWCEVILTILTKKNDRFGQRRRWSIQRLQQRKGKENLNLHKAGLPTNTKVCTLQGSFESPENALSLATYTPLVASQKSSSSYWFSR